MEINIGISEGNRQKVALELSKLLADEYVLYTKTKEAHWNVEGVDFSDKHKLFDEQVEQISRSIDSVAERIRTLGYLVPATLNSFLELTHLTENSVLKSDSRAYMNELLMAHETIIRHLRENISLFADKYGDLGTSDFITSLMQEHEKTAWILRAHLK
ncbi:DNA starvation/stationary phase protection protein [Pedobacter gandavensis]|uniref:Dps family protein n=1 Tax=Pedobacter gandavensis TaxID=2679963 RepID=UPI00247A8B07|nr:DNA starvation/stationary phase protection protein [Pedobacter gandavensis]WGQ09440.1 DNA starvation/stationary phase protection protein [Pedobacter gandavensis]